MDDPVVVWLTRVAGERPVRRRSLDVQRAVMDAVVGWSLEDAGPDGGSVMVSLDAVLDDVEASGVARRTAANTVAELQSMGVLRRGVVRSSGRWAATVGVSVFGAAWLLGRWDGPIAGWADEAREVREGRWVPVLELAGVDPDSLEGWALVDVFERVGVSERVERDRVLAVCEEVAQGFGVDAVVVSGWWDRCVTVWAGRADGVRLGGGRRARRLAVLRGVVGSAVGWLEAGRPDVALAELREVAGE